MSRKRIEKSRNPFHDLRCKAYQIRVRRKNRKTDGERELGTTWKILIREASAYGDDVAVIYLP